MSCEHRTMTRRLSKPSEDGRSTIPDERIEQVCLNCGLTLPEIVDSAVKEVADRNNAELTAAWRERDETWRRLDGEKDREARADERVARVIEAEREGRRQYLEALDGKMRRFALLQAAATVSAGERASQSNGVEVPADGPGFDIHVAVCTDAAEALLAERERRDAEREKEGR